jgi:hypothetical protein
VQASLYHQDTRRNFGPDGTCEPFFADGHAVATSLFVTGALGLVRGLDAWVQASGHRLRYDDAAGRRLRTGPGDLRTYLRAGLPLVGGPDVPVAVRAGVKWPLGAFPVDAETIPLGTGQRDVEVMLEAGHAVAAPPLGLATLYLQGWVGYRWRAPNMEAAYTPGDEAFAFAAAGGRIPTGGPALTWKVAIEGWRGTAPVVQGVVLPRSREAMLQFLPDLGVRVGPGTLTVGARLPFAGQNLPAGPALTLGYFVQWDRP